MGSLLEARRDLGECSLSLFCAFPRRSGAAASLSRWDLGVQPFFCLCVPPGGRWERSEPHGLGALGSVAKLVCAFLRSSRCQLKQPAAAMLQTVWSRWTSATPLEALPPALLLQIISYIYPEECLSFPKQEMVKRMAKRMWSRSSYHHEVIVLGRQVMNLLFASRVLYRDMSRYRRQLGDFQRELHLGIRGSVPRHAHSPNQVKGGTARVHHHPASSVWEKCYPGPGIRF